MPIETTSINTRQESVSPISRNVPKSSNLENGRSWRSALTSPTALKSAAVFGAVVILGIGYVLATSGQAKPPVPPMDLDVTVILGYNSLAEIPSTATCYVKAEGPGGAGGLFLTRDYIDPFIQGLKENGVGAIKIVVDCTPQVVENAKDGIGKVLGAVNNAAGLPN